jgi:uncharacterized repeat protein (TIGR03803 family)
LYGTTSKGGFYGRGTVFQLSHSAGGGIKELVLHHFKGGTDGQFPSGELVLDQTGDLYGTTLYGGKASSVCTLGCGTVFKLSATSGTWEEGIIYSFDGSADAYSPSGGLVFDPNGNVYGVSEQGALCNSSSGCGAVYKLTPSTGGWQESVLYSFGSAGGNSLLPNGVLVLDAIGNLYGTTAYGGGSNACLNGCGTVYELSPVAGGGWNLTTLYSFTNGSDESAPLGGVAFDARGNLFGTAQSGGSRSAGTVFELTPSGSGSWNEKTILAFNEVDGQTPRAGVTLDRAGNVYVTTSNGGSYAFFGTVVKLTPDSTGWNETVLLNFSPAHNKRSGLVAEGRLLIDGNGTLYGTTSAGGTDNVGVVFEIKQ